MSKNRFLNFLCRLFKTKYLSPHLSLDGEADFKQYTMLIGQGKISFGSDVSIGYFPSPYFYSTYAHIEARNPTSFISISDGTSISNNASIISNMCSISIGKNCRIGTSFYCIDSDFHALSKEHRDNPEYIINKAIKIGDNVFVGHNVTILKNVTLGNGCVVAAGSVVTKSFPEDSIIGGNPAQLIRKVEQ